MSHIRTALSALSALAALAALAAPAGAGEREDRARRVLDRDATAKTVVFFAHPEAEYRGAAFVGTAGVTDAAGQPVPTSFALVYRYTWRSPLSGDTNTTKVGFIFAADGSVEVQSMGTTSLFQPFSNTDLVLDFVKEQIRQDPKLGQDRTLMTLVEKGDARSILGFLIRVDAAAGR
jgi:hypothetical protein